MCYLNWLGHVTGHFNVGFYRRVQKSKEEVQDATFFDHSNEASPPGSRGTLPPEERAPISCPEEHALIRCPKPDD